MGQLRGDEADKSDRLHGRSGPVPARGDGPSASTEALNGSEEISLIGLATAVLRYRWWVIAGSFISVALVLVTGSRQHREYTTSASFVPQARRSSTAGGTSALAAQFGLALPSSDPGQSPQFYVDLLTSDEILRNLVDTTYSSPADTGLARATLVDVLGEKGSSKAIRTERTIDALRKSITAGASLKTGVITFTVTEQDPQLAKLVAERLLDRLNIFNLESRTSQAATERRFTEARFAEVQNELRDAENRLESFMQENRDFRTSARLSLEEQRLQREVGMRQQVYTALAQAYQQARLDEERDTPVITVLERPRAAVEPNPRGLLKKVILGLIVGAFIAIFFAFIREYFVGQYDEPSAGSAEFKAVARATLTDMRHPIRALSRKG